MIIRARPLVGLAAGIAALFALSGSLASQSMEVQVLRNQGKATYEEQRFSDAATAFGQVVDSPAAVGQDHLNLALARYRNNNDAGALDALDGADGLLAEHPGASYLRGLVARRAGDLETSRMALERARSLDPTDPAVRYNLGAVYVQLGEQSLGLREFESVIAVGFDIGLQHYVSAVYQTLQSLLREGRRDDAEPLIERYAEDSRRLSPAARTATALEESRWTAVHVPNTSLQPADPDTARAVRLEPAARQTPAGGGLAIGDINLDGRQDWVVTGPSGAVWLSSTDDYAVQPLSTPDGVAALGDFDRDGWPDLYVAGATEHRLLRNVLGDSEPTDTTVVFAPTSATLPVGDRPATDVVWGDYEHDGDLDVLVIRETAGEAGSALLLQNLGNGEFVDTTTESGLDGLSLGGGALWADVDRDYDIDLFVWGEGGTTLFTNQRGGDFTEIGPAVGAAVSAPVGAAAAEDMDNDGRIDLLLATADGVSLLRNVGDGAFLPVDQGVLGASGVGALASADFNNDGYLDLVLLSDDGPRFFANAGGFEFAPFEPLTTDDAPSDADGGLHVADLDGDGAVDMLLEGTGQWRRFVQPDPIGRWLAIRPAGIKNNIQGIGATVEVKTGGSYQVRPLRSSPLHFGIGAADTVDVLRLRWPNGIIQNLLDVATNEVIEVTELERLEGSCPFLYTWDGEGFHFVNEVLGAAPLGMLLAEGVYHDPDPDEYVFVPGDKLRPQDGAFEIRVTEELRETVYLDAVRLLAVDHPASLRILPREGFGGPERPDLELHLYEDLLPVGAHDQDGRDWSEALSVVDGRWAAPFEADAYDGLATEHALTLELPEATGDSVYLHLTGWVYWSMGSVNLAVDQNPTTAFTPVALEVPDGSGGWRTAIDDIGLPIAKNTTLIVDVGSVLVPSDPRVRLRTTMRLYWDAAAYTIGGALTGRLQPSGDWQQRHGVPRPGPMTLKTASDAPSVDAVEVRVLAPRAAALESRGFSAMRRTAEGYETFDYQTVVGTAPWEQHRGLYTAFGDVIDLLGDADDRYIVFATGDEVAIRFDASLPPPREGWRRDYLVYLHGWLKDTDLNTAYGDRVEPLPFHGMSGYPYPRTESYPDDPLHLDFLRHYLTRPHRAINPPLLGGR